MSIVCIPVVDHIYVDGVKKWLDNPRPVSESLAVPHSRWTKVRLRNEPGGLVVSEHSVPRDLFNLDINGRWRTGGHWYSRSPDSSIDSGVAS